MKVLKFGGTSVANASRIKHVVEMLSDRTERKIIVVSAQAGVTNALVNLSEALHREKKDEATKIIAELQRTYQELIEELLTQEILKKQASEMLRAHFNELSAFTEDMFTRHEENAVLAKGELISSTLIHYYCQEQKVSSTLLSALQFMRTDKDGEPDDYYIAENLNRLLNEADASNLYITQGFICRNVFGEIDNLKRGGSDYSASLIGAGINAEEIEIWTDIDGMHNNDPRYVESTFPIEQLSFDEAAELAYFGAKILHPSSIRPAHAKGISVRLKNTMKPEAFGTLISGKTNDHELKAIAAKDGIIAIKVKSDRMLMAYGFLRRVFEVFEVFQTPIDMICTSEIAVSLTIDDDRNLDKLLKSLADFGLVECEKNMCIICVVGNFVSSNKGQASRIFDVLKGIPIRMISYGGSRHNVSIVVESENKIDALKALNTLFQ